MKGLTPVEIFLIDFEEKFIRVVDAKKRLQLWALSCIFCCSLAKNYTWIYGLSG
jgi:hypothetical protein